MFVVMFVGKAYVPVHLYYPGHAIAYHHGFCHLCRQFLLHFDYDPNFHFFRHAQFFHRLYLHSFFHEEKRDQ